MVRAECFSRAAEHFSRHRTLHAGREMNSVSSYNNTPPWDSYWPHPPPPMGKSCFQLPELWQELWSDGGSGPVAGGGCGSVTGGAVRRCDSGTGRQCDALWKWQRLCDSSVRLV